MKNPVYILLAALAALAVLLLGILGVLAGVTGDKQLLALVVSDLQHGLGLIVTTGGPLIAAVIAHAKLSGQPDTSGSDSAPQQPTQPE
jgi:O-antigen ligase